MAKKLKRHIAFLASAAMMFSMLLYLPSGATTDHGFGLTVSAENSTDADDTSTNGGTGDSTPTDTNGSGDSTPTDTNDGTGDSTPADTNGGTGDSTPTDTNGSGDSTPADTNGANNEEDTTNDNAAVLLTASAETAHTHAPCGKESCEYRGRDDHISITYTPFSEAVFECWIGMDWKKNATFNGNNTLDLSDEYTQVFLIGDGNYYLDNDYTITAPNGIIFDGNICLNGYTLTINTDLSSTPAIRTAYITICDCSESNSGSINNHNSNDYCLIDKSNSDSVYDNEIHLFGGNYNGTINCHELYVYDGANIDEAYAVGAYVYGGNINYLGPARSSCSLHQYSGTVGRISSVDKHSDANHDGKCDYHSNCGWSFWKISKPVNGKAIVKAGETTEIGGFESGLNSGSEAYYHISPTYQWYSCDSSGETKTAISGAASDKYNAPAAESAGERYYVCGVSFGGVEEYSKVITVKTVENPKYYNVTDGTAVDNIRTALLDRSDYIELTLSGSALTDINSTNYGDKAQELYNSAFEHITNMADSIYEYRSRLGDYIAKSIGETGMSMVCYTSDGTTVSQVVFGYEPEYYTDKSQEEQVTSWLEKIYVDLDLSELSEQEKVYKIYNWIVNNVSYDYANLNIDENKTKYTAYGALFERRAVCQGFASLFYRMCLDNGIDCRIVTGTSKGENHAWNIVKVGDYYYYADPTWDCFVIEDAANNRQAKPGTFFYFLRGNLLNHTESAEENVTSAYTGSMAAADAYLSAFKAAVVDGTATAVHLDGTPLSDAEKTWYDVPVTDGDGCKKNVAVKGKSTIVSDNDLANMELYSGETEVHTFGTDGFCTNGCSGVYQPATQNEKGVYQVGNAGQLYWFAGLVNGTLEDVTQNQAANAVLTADITVNTGVLKPDGTLADDTSGFRSWTPIGNKSNVYKGTFDGNGKTVSDLYFDDTNTNYVGLFGKISGTIKNVGVVDSYFNGQKFVGGVCGNNNGSIENCYNTGTAISYISNGTHSYVGGVCGYNGSGTITSCYNTGTVSGTEYFVGGVCGSNKGIISNCYNAGEVSGTSNNVGGVCGYNLNSITITNCYNIGEVSGIDNVGGVCGYNSKSTITNCYNTGKVSGTGGYVGGMCGKNCSDGIITNCYYLDTTTSDSNATAKTLTQFGSGEVAYLLQSGQTAGENGKIPEVWGQTIGTDNYPVLGGAKVYLTTPCPGYSNTETKEHTDDNDDGICDVCDKSTDGFGAKLGGHSLSLAGNIAVKFYMELDEAVAADNDAYMKFTLPNGNTTTVLVSAAKQETISDKTYHVFTCEVAAKEMTAAIIAQMFDGSGNSSREYTYTVRDYADYILEHSGSYSAETVALVKAMLNYGGYSQVHFGYNPEKLANADIDTTLPDVTAETLSAYAPQITANNAVCTFASAYLTLESETAANVKVKLADGVTADSVSVTVNGNSVDLSDCEVSNGYYILTVKNIPANQLDKMYTYTLTAGGNTASINFGALSYCYMALSNASTAADVQNMCKSLYAYNLAADTYCPAD